MIDSYKIFIGYILLINLYGFYMMFSDKKRARRKLWRTPEKNIFVAALCGGSIGVLSGMYMFRHKTKHWKFTFGIPVIFIVQIYLFFKLITFINS